MRTIKSASRITQALCVMSVVCALMLSACSGVAATAKEGDTVKVEYTGTLDNGTIFDSSVNESFGHPDPLQFTIGDGKYLEDFEMAVVNMKINETKNIAIPFDRAYGAHNNNQTVTLNWSQWNQFQPGYEPHVGDVLSIRPYNGTILNVFSDGITIDTNHFLAGENINFEITLVEIVSAE